MLRGEKKIKKRKDYFHDETARARIKKEGNFNVRVLLAFLLAVVVSPLKRRNEYFSLARFDIYVPVRCHYGCDIEIYIYISRKNGGETRPRWRFNVFRPARDEGRREQHPGFLLLPINCASKRAKLRLTGPGLTEENGNNP